MIEIDGAHGEGGGQLVRMAVALSALTATPVRVVRIRAGRPVPGLASQHVTALQAVAELCSGELKGVDVGSSTIEFRPGTIAAGRYAFDVGTAGSGTLVLQAVLPVACAASDAVRLHLVGGTALRRFRMSRTTSRSGWRTRPYDASTASETSSSSSACIGETKRSAKVERSSRGPRPNPRCSVRTPWRNEESLPTGSASRSLRLSEPISIPERSSMCTP